MDNIINWEQSGVLLELYGEVNFSVAMELYNTINSDPRYDQCRYQIIDLTHVTDFSLSEEESRQLAAFERASTFSVPNLKMALVINSEVIAGQMAPYFAASIKTPWQQKQFSSVTQVRAWLQV